MLMAAWFHVAIQTLTYVLSSKDIEDVSPLTFSFAREFHEVLTFRGGWMVVVVVVVVVLRQSPSYQIDPLGHHLQLVVTSSILTCRATPTAFVLANSTAELPQQILSTMTQQASSSSSAAPSSSRFVFCHDEIYDAEPFSPFSYSSVSSEDALIIDNGQQTLQFGN